MALKRLDEDFLWASGPLLRELRRLMYVLEARYAPLEDRVVDYDTAIQNLNELGLSRINTILTPVLQDITEMADTGFLVANSTYSVALVVDEEKTWVIEEGAQRRQFRPTLFCTAQSTDDYEDWAIVQVSSYDTDTGALVATIKALGANATEGPHTNWQISGLAGSTLAQLQYYTTGEATAATVAANKTAAEAAQAATQALYDLVADAIEAIQEGPVLSVNGQQGVVTITAASLGAALQTTVDGKVGSIAGLTGPTILTTALKTALNIAAVTDAALAAKLPITGGAAQMTGTINPATLMGTTVTISGETLTLDATAHLGRRLRFTSALSVTVTLPNSFAADWNCWWEQRGDGQITFQNASGALLHNRSDHTRSAGKYAQGQVYVDSNSGGTAADWTLSGDTA